MEYAIQHRTRNNRRNPKRTAVTVTQANRSVCRPDATPERCEPNTERQKTIRTGRTFTDDFLKNRFIPKFAVNPRQTQLSEKQVKQRERDFYKSLSELARYYGFIPADTEKYPYPYNFVLAYSHAVEQIRKLPDSGDFDDLQILLDDETDRIYLAVKERYDTGRCIFYVPAMPLFRMLKDRQRKRSARLLLSVYCYLYRIIGLPYYRDDGTYLYWQYEMIKEWKMEENDMEDNRIILSELCQAELIGNRIERKIINSHNLQYWKQRIQTFKAGDSFDNDVFLLAVKFYNLYLQFSEQSIFKNIIPIYDGGEYYYDEEENLVTMHKYIGFIPDNNGELFDNLCESVNADFAQYGDIQEPEITILFDGTTHKQDKLHFENRIFPLISELCYLLNNYSSKSTQDE